MARTVDERLTLVEIAVKRIERMIRDLASRATDGPDDADSPGPRGRWWFCSRCRAKLGFWTHDSATLSMHRADFTATVVVAPGTLVGATCHRCSTEQRFDPPAPISPPS